MTAPIRIQLKRTKGWRMPANTVKVARPSAYGNPWHVGIDGDAPQCVDAFRCLLAAHAISAWPRDPTEQIRARHFPFNDTIAAALRGKNLACWCKIGAPCHADVLLEIANAKTEVQN